MALSAQFAEMKFVQFGSRETQLFYVTKTETTKATHFYIICKMIVFVLKNYNYN